MLRLASKVTVFLLLEDETKLSARGCRHGKKGQLIYSLVDHFGSLAQDSLLDHLIQNRLGLLDREQQGLPQVLIVLQAPGLQVTAAAVLLYRLGVQS